MRNFAGRTDYEELDADCAKELHEAGIEAQRGFEVMRKHMGEVSTLTLGHLYRWSFRRAWTYWVCEGPGLPPEAARKLHASHGGVCRVDGDCTAPCPIERLKGLGVNMYHVDTQEGLNALAAAIRSCIITNQIIKPGEKKE